MWPGFLAAQIVREYSLLLIFLCKIFPENSTKRAAAGEVFSMLRTTNMISRKYWGSVGRLTTR